MEDVDSSKDIFENMSIVIVFVLVVVVVFVDRLRKHWLKYLTSFCHS